MPWPPSSQPYNFFAGAVPAAPEPLAYVAGYYYVITSITVWAPNGSDTEEVLIVDAEGNRRVHATIGPTGDYAIPFLNWRGEMVLGNVDGAIIYATGDQLYCSVDGYGFPPQDSPIW